MSTFVDIHVIQNVPPSNLNRDDAGSPKSAVYGGTRRLRVSSQSWKRAARLYFRDHLDRRDLGTRTKRVVEVVSSAIAAQAPELTDRAEGLAEAVFKAAKIKVTAPKVKKEGAARPAESGYLLFLSNSQISRLAAAAIASANSGEGLDAKAVKAIFKEEQSIDVALFGRMVADDTDLNVDAACQVAHALSVHPAENEYDFFTAVDDAKAEGAEEDSGAGMMGTVEFSSATLYRYATVNLDLLRENLGDDEATVRATTAFIEAFVRAMPTGKQNTFANRTLPEAAVVQIRGDQPVSLVGAFEKAVVAAPGVGYVERSMEELAAHEHRLEETYGIRPQQSLVVSLVDGEAVDSLGERVSFPELVDAVRVAVTDSLVRD